MAKPTVVFCITEGERDEPKVLRALQAKFLINQNIKIISFKSNIYELYRRLKAEDDDFLDVYAVLQEMHFGDEILSSHQRSEVSQIYLFFDYDGHATSADNSVIEEMLTFFSEETEHGKLYVSYPMFEAYKEPISDARLVLSPIDLGKKYKAEVNQRCDQSIHKISSFQRASWMLIFSSHFAVAKALVMDEQSAPTYENLIKDLTQLSIFKCQLSKLILPLNQVRVLSALPFFMLEYKGQSLLSEMAV